MATKSDKIKKAIENKGYQNVKIWWEHIRAGAEMCGPERGLVFYSRQWIF